MSLVEFYRMIFMLAFFAGIVIFAMDIIEYAKSVYYKKRMYYTLEKMWHLSNWIDSGSDKKIRKVMHEECKNLHFKYVLNNKFLRESFHSPEDILKAFITTVNSNKDCKEKFEILYEESKKEIKPYEIYEKKSVIKKFDIISVLVTIVGIIVTIVSLF